MNLYVVELSLSKKLLPWSEIGKDGFRAGAFI
jgi:hypothetical protein